MAMLPLCYKIPSTEQVLPNPNSIRNRTAKYGQTTIAEHMKYFCSALKSRSNRWDSIYPASHNSKNMKTKMLMEASGEARVCFPLRYLDMSFLKMHNSSTGDNSSIVCYASESKRQLRLLDSYFAKTYYNVNQISSNQMSIPAKKELDSLDTYLGKLEKDDSNEDRYPEVTSFSADVTTDAKLKGHRWLTPKDLGNEALQEKDEISDFYLISTLASVNIAVFLFGIASPISNSHFELFSIPSLYGAKINDLILIGEWWRLLTPMFLHSGVFHVALGCWALLSFGPQVCKVYGSFTFLLIYTLGGISGNLISFLHTSEPTVGGTGPVFAVIGAWLIYQIQNQTVITGNLAESMIQKAIITTALGCIVSNFGFVDNWTHFGAGFIGVMYGYLTCPVVQMDERASRSQEERIILIEESADPCKSMLLFAAFILVLGSLLLFFEPPLTSYM